VSFVLMRRRVHAAAPDKHTRLHEARMQECRMYAVGSCTGNEREKERGGRHVLSEAALELLPGRTTSVCPTGHTPHPSKYKLNTPKRQGEQGEPTIVYARKKCTREHVSTAGRSR